MSGGEPWFTVAETESLGSGRRLGLPGRPAPLPTPPPNRLLIPPLTVATARTQPAAWQAPERGSVIAEAAPRAEVPRRLPEIALTEEESLRGSVSLLGRLGLAPPEPAPWERKLTESGGGPGRRGLPWVEEDGVPLARRLAVVLGPSTELLLTHHGPLAWPRPFRPYQIDGIRELLTRDALLLADDMGLGKSQPDDAPVLTPTGWTTVGALQVGDWVIGGDGRPTRVVGVFPQGELEVYRVTFSDGAVAECSDDHLWPVQTPNDRVRGGTVRVLPLREIRARLRDGAGNRRWANPLPEPIAFPEQTLALDPYLVGVLIGDGGLAHRAIVTTADDEIAAAVSSLLPAGVVARRLSGHDYGLRGPGAGLANPLVRAPRDLGLFGHGARTKFIPPLYLIGSVEQRLALLQGLLDTDGWVCDGSHVGFCTVSARLRDDVIALVRSLGGRATFSTTTRTGAFDLTIQLPAGMPPFRLERKRLAHTGPPKYPPSRWFDRIEPVRRAPCTCIMVDAAHHTYVTSDYVVTHNTVQAIAALRIMAVQRRIESALVVTPAGLLGQWRTELRRWAGELRVSTVHGEPSARAWQWRAPAHVYLTSYETLRSDSSSHVHAPVNRRWDLVVLDEAQKIKNADSEVSRVCKQLKRARQWALTGTPLENSPDDLRSLLGFIDPAAGDDLHHFIAHAGLRAQLGRFQLRRRKADVLDDLPEKLVSEIVLPLSPRQRESYDRVERDGIMELRGLGQQVTIEHVFNLVLRLRQICNVCPRSGESSKLTDLRERIGVLAAEGHKALVFTQFTNAAYGARAIAARLGSAALVYTGDMGQSERERVLARFREDPDAPVLILSLGAGGQGLNLQAASYVFHFDRWWNPAVERQAEARSHRIGQPRAVNVYTYTSERTIEERITHILRGKQRLFDELVEDVSLDPTEGVGLTNEDLLALFGLSAG